MKKMWAAYAAIAAILYFIANTLYTAGSFKSIEPHMDGTLGKVYVQVPGPEDMAADEDLGLLFISSTDRWKTLNGQASDDGIFLLRPDSSQNPHKLPTTYKGSFHPHGISLYQDHSTSYLFAVNHNASGSFVEIFEYRNDSLFHLRSVSDASMCCPNDVVAVGKDQFYVTNDHGTPKGFMRTLEEYLRLPFSKLLFYDGDSMRLAHKGMNYANGVNISNDRSRLFVATTTGQNLLVFDRDSTNGLLTLRNKLKLHTGVDNIDVDRDGTLWIAAHPKLLAFVSHAKDSSKRSPSQVLQLLPSTEKQGYTVKEVFLDDGSTLSGSSIATRYKDEIFVGGVFERKILRVKLKESR